MKELPPGSSQLAKDVASSAVVEASEVIVSAIAALVSTAGAIHDVVSGLGVSTAETSGTPAAGGMPASTGGVVVVPSAPLGPFVPSTGVSGVAAGASPDGCSV